MPEPAQDSQGIVPGSGGVSAEPFASWDRSSWSWRTSQGSLLEDSTSFSGPWPASGVMRNGKLYARATSGRHSFARESSLWLTPNATPGATSNNGENAGRPATGKSLAKQADGRWPTPRAEDSESSGRRQGRDVDDTLTAKARASWPTPNAGESIRGSDATADREGSPTLTGAVRSTWPTPTAGDSESAGSRNLEGSEAHAGVSLTDAARYGNSTTPRSEATWMTPQSRDHKGISQKVAKGEYTGGLPDQLLGMQRGEAGPPAQENHNTLGSLQGFSPQAVGDATWPTPQAYQAPEGMGKPTSTPLDRAVTEPGPSRATKGGQLTPRPLVLNPRWVLCLMGFPATYLDGVAPPSKRSGTRSSRKSAPSSPVVSASSPAVSENMRDDARNALDCTPLPARLRAAAKLYQWLHGLLHEAADVIEKHL